MTPKLGFGVDAPQFPYQDASSISAETAALFKSRLSELALNKHDLIVLYPSKTELLFPTTHYQSFKTALGSSVSDCCALLELREKSEWTAEQYSDAIHPSAQGNLLFARLISKKLEKF